MGITKTDFIRGMQCPKMLWLDRNKPEKKEIPPKVRKLLDGGNAYGDSLMGMFGPYTEVREYVPETNIPDKARMVKKTAELIAAGTKIICEAAFMDHAGNYCAVDILRWDDTECRYDMYEIKNASQISERFIVDAAFQANLIRRTGLPLGRVFIVYHGEEPYDIEEITQTAAKYSSVIEENIGLLSDVADQHEEYNCAMGIQCACPYECWYYSYCRDHGSKERTTHEA